VEIFWEAFGSHSRSPAAEGWQKKTDSRCCAANRMRTHPDCRATADRLPNGINPVDTDSIALVVKKWTGRAGFDGTAFAGHGLRRGAISSGVAQGVHIARLKQFSGHASLKSLEGYIELDGGTITR
jgi:hypothetical protein